VPTGRTRRTGTHFAHCCHYPTFSFILLLGHCATNHCAYTLPRQRQQTSCPVRRGGCLDRLTFLPASTEFFMAEGRRRQEGQTSWIRYITIYRLTYNYGILKPGQTISALGRDGKRQDTSVETRALTRTSAQQERKHKGTGGRHFATQQHPPACPPCHSLSNTGSHCPWGGTASFIPHMQTGFSFETCLCLSTCNKYRPSSWTGKDRQAGLPALQHRTTKEEGSTHCARLRRTRHLPVHCMERTPAPWTFQHTLPPAYHHRRPPRARHASGTFLWAPAAPGFKQAHLGASPSRLPLCISTAHGCCCAAHTAFCRTAAAQPGHLLPLQAPHHTWHGTLTSYYHTDPWAFTH